MKNISINYITKRNLQKDHIEKISNGCNSKKYKVDITLHDFSLSKKNKELINDKDIQIAEYDYEDFENAETNILKNIVQFVDSAFVAIVNDNVLINNIDRINFEEISKIDFLGLVYSDYSLNGTRCFLRSHRPDIKIGLPLSFWCADKLIKHVSQEEKLAEIYSRYIGFHVPENICSIESNEK